jgi:hypothetical protein
MLTIERRALRSEGNRPEPWSEGANLEAADLQPCRCCQARTVGMSTLGVVAGGLGARGPSAVAVRFVPEQHVTGIRLGKQSPL